MKKVLVVEDELSIANYLIDLIEALGYECRLLTSGKAVVETVKKWNPDLVTLDLAMPSPDGLQVLGSLKTDEATKMVPVFVVSAIVNQPGIPDKLKQAQHVFEKPLDTKQFIQEIREVCGE